jgi:hypothetical protein
MHTTSTSHSPCFSLILTSSAAWPFIFLLKYNFQPAIDKAVAGHIDHVEQY